MSDPTRAPLRGRSLWLMRGLLVLMGAGWGITQPLTKIAVDVGYGHFVLIFWQMCIASTALCALTLMRGGRLRLDGPALRVYLVIALIGTLLPNSASYKALGHLPAGLVALALAIIPMLAFPIAVALGTDRFSWLRLGGLGLGLLAVAMIVLPDTVFPEPGMAGWMLVALIAPMFYACEANYVARWGTAGLSPLEVITGASIMGMILSAPLMLATGQYRNPLIGFGWPETAFILSTLTHISVYIAYVWMAGRAGATFAAQVSYLVTGFGVVWSMLLLGERYALVVWLAFGLMLAGMALVQPRPTKALGKRGAKGEIAPQR